MTPKAVQGTVGGGNNNKKILTYVLVLGAVSLGLYLLLFKKKSDDAVTGTNPAGLDIEKGKEVATKLFNIGKEKWDERKAKRDAEAQAKIDAENKRKADAMKSAGLRTY